MIELFIDCRSEFECQSHRQLIQLLFPFSALLSDDLFGDTDTTSSQPRTKNESYNDRADHGEYSGPPGFFEDDQWQIVV